MDGVGNAIIIADDLTGANDTGVQFCEKGQKTTVIVNHKQLQDIFVYGNKTISINTDSRHLSVEDAYQQVYQTMKLLNSNCFNLFYKKMDSIMRGHPGIEMDAMMDALGSNLAIVSPAFPDMNRIVEDGILVSKSQKEGGEEKRFNISDILKKETKRNIGNIDLSTIRKGLMETIYHVKKERAKGNDVIVMDAKTEEDLEIIAQVGKSFEEKVVFVGSAGLARNLNKLCKRSNKDISVERGKKSVILIVVGTRNPVTAAQVEELLSTQEICKISINTNKIVKGNMTEVNEDFVNGIEKYLKKENLPEVLLIVVDGLYTSTEASCLSYPEDDVKSKAISLAVGKLTKRVVETETIKTIIATGGDTSLNICHELGARGIQLLGEVISGVPVGKLMGGIGDKMMIVTKSGGFGNKKTFIEIIDYFKTINKENKEDEK